MDTVKLMRAESRRPGQGADINFEAEASYENEISPGQHKEELNISPGASVLPSVWQTKIVSLGAIDSLAFQK